MCSLPLECCCFRHLTWQQGNIYVVLTYAYIHILINTSVCSHLCLYYSKHELILMSPTLSIATWTVIVPLFLDCNLLLHTEEHGSHSQLRIYLLVQFQCIGLVISEFLICTSMGNDVINHGMVLLYSLFWLPSYRLHWFPKLGRVPLSSTPFSEFVSYICNIVRHFCHSLYSTLWSP